MLSRRDLLSSAIASSAGASDFGQPSDRAMQDIVKAVGDLRSALIEPHSFTDIARVRTRQVEFLRSQAKFPDFMEVGVDVWLAVYDWHVRHLQPITLGRDPSGRYTLVLLVTTLILRIDADANFVGVPYDTPR
ncbi:MAG TPA: hypothetical protein VFI56_14870 [Vicinamibacterales bacterium]|nr:hypothetical protein [Vicinamibacterales bacterium]